jgi:hypothetical protein
MAITAQVVEILDAVTQIRRLVTCVMLQGGILYPKKKKKVMKIKLS